MLLPKITNLVHLLLKFFDPILLTTSWKVGFHFIQPNLRCSRPSCYGLLQERSHLLIEEEAFHGPRGLVGGIKGQPASVLDKNSGGCLRINRIDHLDAWAGSSAHGLRNDQARFGIFLNTELRSGLILYLDGWMGLGYEYYPNGADGPIGLRMLHSGEAGRGPSVNREPEEK